MKAGLIRPVAICIFHDGDKILVSELYDPSAQETFYRPLGGAIEFGERSSEAVVRELREEIRAEITNLRYIGTIENLFTYDGQMGHEIVLVYEADLADKSLYDKEVIEGQEDDGMTLKVVWKSLDEFSEHSPLYPQGLVDLLYVE
ncbi:MAG: NUDIX hydrolase [Chloroflexi bacterium]|nr:NUDIX hydrolase [Chloroflexota bacterium]